MRALKLGFMKGYANESAINHAREYDNPLSHQDNKYYRVGMINDEFYRGISWRRAVRYTALTTTYEERITHLLASTSQQEQQRLRAIIEDGATIGDATAEYDRSTWRLIGEKNPQNDPIIDYKGRRLMQHIQKVVQNAQERVTEEK